MEFNASDAVTLTDMPHTYPEQESWNMQLTEFDIRNIARSVVVIKSLTAKISVAMREMPS